MNTSHSNSSKAEFPLVVQAGFAGSRKIPAECEAEIRKLLSEEIAGLRSSLNLKPRHFLCGISQLAIGADTLFTQVCKAASIPQRIFLPQHRDEFLNVAASVAPSSFGKLLAGKPDGRFLESRNRVRHHFPISQASTGVRRICLPFPGRCQ